MSKLQIPFFCNNGKLFTNDTIKMSILIEDKMLTATSVSIDEQKPAKFTIVRNDETTIIALYLDDGLIDPGENSFVLNKKSGLAVWTKSKPSFFGQNVPDSQVCYMECR